LTEEEDTAEEDRVSPVFFRSVFCPLTFSA
jgi:hypothetical protein